MLESTSPIDVLTAEDIRKAGVLNGELGSALQALLPSFNFPRQSNSGGADHVRAAQLRGLSPNQVLVLVNGKRRHTSALVNTDSKIGKGTTPVDFNAIPVSAIKRIEVLRDGAGAQYGSDAVAGVINVILNDAPEGGAYEASFGVHHTDVEPIDQTVTDGQTSFASAQVGSGIGDGGFFRVGLELKNREATNRAGFDQIPFFEEQTPDNLALAGQRNYLLGDGESEGHQRLAQQRRAGGRERRSSTPSAPTTRATPKARTTSAIPMAWRTGRRCIRTATARSPTARTSTWPAWPACAGSGATGTTTPASTTAATNSPTACANSLNASLGPGSPDALQDRRLRVPQTLRQLRPEPRVRRGATITFATGLEFRRETFETGAGDPASYAAGPFTDRPTGSQAGGGLTPQDTADLDARCVQRLRQPVSSQCGEKFTTDIAARYEHYDDFGGELTGKLAARYEFAPAFALRGSVSNNFRAPSLSQIGFESTSTGYDASGQLTQGRLLSVNNPIAQALGAQDLEPEKSLNFSLGFTSRIGEHFDVSLDVFRIDIDDRVALTERISGDALTDFVLEEFGVPGVQSVNFFINAADTRTEGAELVANWRQPLGGGNLLLSGAYSYAKTEIKRITATPAELLPRWIRATCCSASRRATR